MEGTSTRNPGCGISGANDEIHLCSVLCGGMRTVSPKPSDNYRLRDDPGLPKAEAKRGGVIQIHLFVRAGRFVSVLTRMGTARSGI